eukprot:sb/3468135/
MRCFNPSRSTCLNNQDQTNCSDPERVTMQCLSQGFSTTISIWGYCFGYQLCDDNYNNVCVDPEPGCTIHKGQLCDGHPDCNNGGDETCSDRTKVSCIRRFHSQNGQKNVSLPIPLEWVMDGEVDCLDGKDEDETQWLKCGKDYYTRYRENGTECKEVLLCPLEKNYIDRINTCSFEEKLCNAARKTDIDVRNLIDTFLARISTSSSIVFQPELQTWKGNWESATQWNTLLDSSKLYLMSNNPYLYRFPRKRSTAPIFLVRTMSMQHATTFV